MGYYSSIVENDLKSKKDISQKLKEELDKNEFYLSEE